MNFFDYALRDLPANLYRKIGTVFKDIATANGTSTANLTFGQPLVAGSGGAAVIGLGGANTFTINESNFVAGRERGSFTLVCAILPLSVTQEMAVLSHTTASPRDGISVDQDNIVFRVKFAAGNVDVKWEFPDFVEGYIVHAAYTPNSIKLYINGEPQRYTDIPADYLASGFVTAGDGSLSAGLTSGSNDRVLVDALVEYPYALTDEQVKAQFIAARDTVPMEINVSSMTGTVIDGSHRRILDQVVFNGTSGWNGIASTDVSTTSGELIPQVDQDTGASKAGTWIGQFVIDNTDITSLSGIKAEWNGNGSFTVQSSLDGGSTYQTVTNGELIPTSQGLNPAGKTLLVQISFAGGIVDDVSEVRDLTLTTYADNYVYTNNNDARKLTINGNVSTTLVQNQPIERNAMPGIHVYGGSLSMPQDTEESPASIQALEFVVNPKGVTSGTGGYLFDTRPYGGTGFMWLQESLNQWAWDGASAVYINGQPATSPVSAVKGDSVHILFVFPTAFNTAIDFATGNQIADYNLIGAYPIAPTPSQAAQLYSNYTSYPVATMAETGKVTMTENPNAYSLTLANWAMLPQQ